MLKKIADALQSVTAMIIFVIVVLIANFFIFSTGFAENDARTLTTLERNMQAIIKISQITGISPLTGGDIILAPLGIGNNVLPVLTYEFGNINICEGKIENKFYIYQCPFRKGIYLKITADRTKIIASIWRDLSIAATTTIPGLIFLVLFAIIGHKRKQELARQNVYLNSRNRVLETITFSLFHDLSGPLADTTFARDLLKELLSPEKIEELGLTDVATLLSAGVDRQTNILNGLQVWVRAGKADIPTKMVDLTEVVQDLVDKSFYLATITVDKLPTRKSNADLFREIIDNLIRNGIKYNDKLDKRIKIYSTGYNVVVEDNGIGFDITQFDRITQPFQRIKYDQEGNGLGLAIVRQIVEARGHTLKAESTIGVGSKFIIEFGT